MIRKNVTVLMMVMYYLAGVSAATWSTEHWHLDVKLSLLVLPLMYLAHLAGNALAGKHKRQACLGCQKEIGLFRRLAHHRFCCDEHEHLYFAEMDELGIERLRNARPAASNGNLTVEIARLAKHHVNAGRREVLPDKPEETLSRRLPSAVATFRPSPA